MAPQWTLFCCKPKYNFERKAFRSIFKWGRTRNRPWHTITTMFKNEFQASTLKAFLEIQIYFLNTYLQGGPAFELFSSHGTSSPLTHWKFLNKGFIGKTYEKDVKVGFVQYECVYHEYKLTQLHEGILLFLWKDRSNGPSKEWKADWFVVSMFCGMISYFASAYLIQPFLAFQILLPLVRVWCIRNQLVSLTKRYT